MDWGSWGSSCGERRGWGSSGSKLACVELPSEEEILLSSPFLQSVRCLGLWRALACSVCTVQSSRGALGHCPRFAPVLLHLFPFSTALQLQFRLEYRAGQMCFLCSLCSPAAGREREPLSPKGWTKQVLTPCLPSGESRTLQAPFPGALDSSSGDLLSLYSILILIIKEKNP